VRFAAGGGVGVAVAGEVRQKGEGVDCSGGTQGLTPTIGSGGLGGLVLGGPMHRIASRIAVPAVASPAMRRIHERYAHPRTGRMTRTHRTSALGRRPQNAFVSATEAMLPCGFWYVRRVPPVVSSTVMV